MIVDITAAQTVDIDAEVGAMLASLPELHTNRSRWTSLRRACVGAYRECRFVCGGVFGRQETLTGRACRSTLSDCIECCKLVAMVLVMSPLFPLALALVMLAVCAIVAVFSVQGFVMTAAVSGCAFTSEPLGCTADAVWYAFGHGCSVRINETHYGPTVDDQTSNGSARTLRRDVSPSTTNRCRASVAMGMGTATMLFDMVACFLLLLGWAIWPRCALFARNLYDDIREQRAHWHHLDE